MKKSIAIVEDNPDISQMISLILGYNNFDLQPYLTAYTFNTSLICKLPDLILLDVMLPDGNGIEICKRLKSDSHTSHIPIVLMSANSMNNEMLSASQAECFIGKPFDISNFKNKVTYFLS